MKFFLHADLDAFYASVEVLDHPEYAGKPVIIDGLPGDRRSVVSTASYEARKYGVHSAMPVVQAVKLCPDGIYLRPNMKRYQEKSDAVMSIFAEFSPVVRQLSIDEAFLDITGTEKIFGPPVEMAKKLKNRIREETGLTVSTGLASNKYLAKIASGIQKPDGLCFIAAGDETKFMLDLPVDKIWGAGKKTQEVFAKHGLKTCRDIYNLSRGALHSIFGNGSGDFLYHAVRGEEAESFETIRGSHSMSTERTFAYDLFDEFEMETHFLQMAEELFFRLLEEGNQSKTVFVKLRYGKDFTTVSARETRDQPVSTLNEFYDRLIGLFRNKYKKGQGIRLLGAGFGNIEDRTDYSQNDLFDAPVKKEQNLEKTILEINTRFPGAVKRGRLVDR